MQIRGLSDSALAGKFDIRLNQQIGGAEKVRHFLRVYILRKQISPFEKSLPSQLFTIIGGSRKKLTCDNQSDIKFLRDDFKCRDEITESFIRSHIAKE